MKRFVEPQLEVMRRLHFNAGSLSIAQDGEMKLYKAACELVVEGYLVNGGPYYAGGRWYRKLYAGPLTDMSALREIT